jgi:hypothetical protein
MQREKPQPENRAYDRERSGFSIGVHPRRDPSCLMPRITRPFNGQ